MAADETANRCGAGSAVRQAPTAGMDMDTSHDIRHCEWARGGNVPHGREGAGEGRLRPGTVEGVSRQQLPRPLLEPVILANQRPPTPAGSARDRGGRGRRHYLGSRVVNKCTVQNKTKSGMCGRALHATSPGEAQRHGTLWTIKQWKRLVHFDHPPTAIQKGGTRRW